MVPVNLSDMFWAILLHVKKQRNIVLDNFGALVQSIISLGTV